MRSLFKIVIINCFFENLIKRMKIDFEHRQLSHCENGTICNLLNFHEFKISEPLVFGIGSGLFFAFMPFVKNHGIPLTSYRILPGKIYSNATKLLGINMFKRKYKDKKTAMDELDATLEKGQPAGLLTNLYYLPFFPKSYRFHYNAHNTIIYGKENNTYLVSDPVLEHTSEISYENLMKARFAEGILSVKGDMYYPLSVSEISNIEKAIVKGIKSTCNLMVKNPIPYHGITGIKMMARRIKKKKNDTEFLRSFLGNVIRMQEEAGTGGAGFRYMYAAFLQEAAVILKLDWMIKESEEMTEIGDRWRDFALNAGRVIKDRNVTPETFKTINQILLEIAEREKKLFKQLSKIKYVNAK